MRYLRTAFLTVVVAVTAGVCRADDTGSAVHTDSATAVSTQPPAGVPTGGSFLRMFGGLLFCLGVFGAGIHISKRYGVGHIKKGKRRMKVLEKLPISQKSSLLLVSCDGREILLTVGPDQARVLQAQLSATQMPQSRDYFEESFADMYSIKPEDKQCVG